MYALVATKNIPLESVQRATMVLCVQTVLEDLDVKDHSSAQNVHPRQ